MGFSPGAGGGSSIFGSTDVALNNPANNNVLSYDTSLSKWKNNNALTSRSGAQPVGQKELVYSVTDYGLVPGDIPTNRLLLTLW